MKRLKLIFVLFILLLSNNGCNDNPAIPEDQRPIILSLTIFPQIIAMGDSAIVVCNAMDPDADTLVYDWISDGRVRIKGIPTYDHSEYNTFENYLTIYPTHVATAPYDTLWVQCFARDRKGKSASGIVTAVVVQ